MSTKPSWDSFFDHNEKADADFIRDRPPIIEERCQCRMNGKIEFDGTDFFVVIPQELLHRVEIKAGDEIEILGECLPSGYKITIASSDQEA